MEDEKNEQNEQEAFPLDDAAIALLSEYDEQERKLMIAAESLNGARTGMLTLFLRQHGLNGNWNVAPNRRELVKAVQPVPQPVAEN